MLYIVMDQIENGDLFTSEFETENEAIDRANLEWNRLNNHDKKRREYFHVIKSVNPDENAENHFDGDIIYQLK